MNTKRTLLAIVSLVAVGTAAAIAGSDKSHPSTPAAGKPAGMSCCARGMKAPAAAAEKEAPVNGGMSCHTKAAAPKSCCK